MFPFIAACLSWLPLEIAALFTGVFVIFLVATILRIVAAILDIIPFA